MANYPYIIAGLPDILLNFEKSDYDYQTVRDNIYELCEKDDCALIDLLERGFNLSTMDEDLYQQASKSSSSFIRRYFELDYNIRCEKVAFLKSDIFDGEYELKDEIIRIFNISNIIERERSLDMLLWNMMEEMVLLEVLSFDIVLSSLVELHIVSRWSKMDKKRGEELFRQFVNEVNDTYNESKNR